MSRARRTKSSFALSSRALESLERRSLFDATISGIVVQDLSGNGLSVEDSPLAGVVVKLYQDKNGNGALDDTDGAAIAQKTSAAVTGRFAFTGLDTGKYILEEIPGANHVRVEPLFDNTIAVDVTKSNGEYGSNVFANYVKTDQLSEITGVSYTINGTRIVTTLADNVQEGDTVTANFTVKAGKTIELSLVAYKADAPFSTAENLQFQEISDVDTGTFTAGQHSLTVVIPECYFQVDFVIGPAIDPFGPAGSNILYGAQDRLISYDNGGTKPCDCECPPPEEEHVTGRMTGGGSVFLDADGIGADPGTRITHGFQLHCAQVDKDGGPIEQINNRLQINWDRAKFHLYHLTAVECFDTPLDQTPPKHAPIDTLVGEGLGRFSGTFDGRKYKMVDASIQFTLTDAGEPGIDDTSDYRIVVLDGNQDGVANDPVVVLDTNGALTLNRGNHQTHREITPLVRAAEQFGSGDDHQHDDEEHDHDELLA